MSHAIGIDLGTTNSVLAVYQRGRVRTVRIDGANTMPSVVSFCPDGSVLVGQPAKARMSSTPSIPCRPRNA